MTLRLPLLLAAIVMAAMARVEAVEVPARSISSSKQFIIYCNDGPIRARVTGFTEEVKADVLRLLNESDRWKFPIVIRIDRAQASVEAPVTLQFFETPDGATLQMQVRIGGDPSALNLQKQIVRALLLEISYRDRGGVRSGEAYIEPPWWLVDGAVHTFQRRDLGIESDLFKRLVEANRLPSIQEFLALKGGQLGATAEAIDAACAMCFVQLLIEQPGGRANLGRFVRNWPERHADPAAAIAKDFPMLGESPGALQKWWTVGVARFAAANRHEGLSAEETERELAALLQFELEINKAGEKKTFHVREFEEFMKAPARKAMMMDRQAALIALSTRANAMLRPVVADYEQIFSALVRGKTRGLERRLEHLERYRDAVLRRTSEIADYLNWFEATQFGTRSDAFESFLKAANSVSKEEAEHTVPAPIAEYLDQLQQEF